MSVLKIDHRLTTIYLSPQENGLVEWFNQIHYKIYGCEIHENHWVLLCINARTFAVTYFNLFKRLNVDGMCMVSMYHYLQSLRDIFSCGVYMS